MRRREFIGLVGAAAGWSFGAQAQQRPMPVVGFLRSTSREDSTRLITAFQQGIHELVPKAAIIAILNHSAHSGADFVLQDAQNAARALGAQLEIVNVGEEDRDLEAAFTSLAQKNIKALVVPGGAFLLSHRNQVVALAPAMQFLRFTPTVSTSRLEVCLAMAPSKQKPIEGQVLCEQNSEGR